MEVHKECSICWCCEMRVGVTRVVRNCTGLYESSYGRMRPGLQVGSTLPPKLHGGQEKSEMSTYICKKGTKQEPKYPPFTLNKDQQSLELRCIKSNFQMVQEKPPPCLRENIMGRLA